MAVARSKPEPPDPIQEQIDDDLADQQFRAELEEWLDQVEDDDREDQASHDLARRIVGLPPRTTPEGAPPG